MYFRSKSLLKAENRFVCYWKKSKKVLQRKHWRLKDFVYPKKFLNKLNTGMPIYPSVVCGVFNSLQQNNMIQNASCFSLFRLFIVNVLGGLIRGISHKIFDLHIFQLSFKRQQKCWIHSQNGLRIFKQKM